MVLLKYFFLYWNWNEWQMGLLNNKVKINKGISKRKISHYYFSLGLVLISDSLTGLLALHENILHHLTKKIDPVLDKVYLKQYKKNSNIFPRLITTNKLEIFKGTHNLNKNEILKKSQIILSEASTSKLSWKNFYRRHYHRLNKCHLVLVQSGQWKPGFLSNIQNC